MSIGIKITLFVLLSSIVIRALYIVMSYGAGGENSLDRPGLVIRFPKVPDIATLFLPIAIGAVGFVGYKLISWSGLFGLPLATLLIGCPLLSALLKQRETLRSFLFLNPFIHIVVFMPVFVVTCVLLSI